MSKEAKKKAVSIGSWLMRPDPGIAEVMATSRKFDWLCVDIEHSALTIYHVENLVRIIQLTGLEAFVRISSNDPVLIKRVLDTGVDGLIIPMVNNADDVKNAIDASYYPTKGRRGVGLARAQCYGTGFDDYRLKRLKKLKIVVQIEHINAVNNIDQILTQEGIWAYFIGPYDLSASLGKPGDFRCDEVKEALAVVKKAGEKYGIRAGYHVVEPDRHLVISKIDEGYEFIAVSLDMLFLQRGIELAF